MKAPGYQLVAIDLDGTLLDSASRVSEANVKAVARARLSGMKVIVCTGRGLVECRHYLDAIGQTDPVVVAGGSIIACPVTSRTIHHFKLDHALVGHAVGRIHSHGYPALILKDPVEAGYDYLVVTGDEDHPIDPVTRWWFQSMDVKVRYARRLSDDAHPEHTVRLGACGMSGAMARVEKDLSEAFGGELHMHHFPAVVAPDHASRDDDGQALHVLEVFDRDANKWSAIDVLARGWGIEPDRVAAIGDQINDVSMLRHAGLGIAMGNAVPAALAAADRRTLPNDQDGVAHAIDRILAGEW